MNMLLAVALGGAVGAVLRYKITLWSAAALGAGFPMAPCSSTWSAPSPWVWWCNGWLRAVVSTPL